MIYLYIRKTFRNKWLLYKVFIFSPILSILPITLIQQNYNINSSQSILHLILWNFFYFSCFETVNSHIKQMTSEKLYEIFISKTSFLVYNTKEMIATSIVFLPSVIVTFILYKYLYQITFPKFNILCLYTIAIFMCNILFMLFLLTLQLKYRNYFNKFNLFMEALSSLIGILFPVSMLPILLRWYSYTLPMTYIYEYSRSGIFFNIWEFLIWYIIHFILGLFCVKLAINSLRKKGI